MKSPRDAAVQNSIAKLEHDAKLAKHFSHTLATQQKTRPIIFFFKIAAKRKSVFFLSRLSIFRVIREKDV